MSSDINLSAAIRSSLITLQGAQTLINRTQNDLSTGLKVNNAIDNPVSYFQAQALTDRASDFSNKKDGIDQGISSLSTALEGITGIQNIVGQLQGLVLSAESASSTQIPGLVSQYNNLRTQVNTLAKDTSYQGLNLIAGTGQVLSVSFSTLTSSNLTVNSVDVTSDARGLGLAEVTSASVIAADSTTKGFQISFNSNTGGKITTGTAGAINNTFYFSGTAATFSAGSIAEFKYGSVTLTLTIGSAGSTTSTFTDTQTFTDGEVLSLKIASVATANTVTNATAASSIKLTAVTGQFVLSSSLPATTNLLLTELQANLLDLRSQSQAVGSNVALLNTRLDFTNNYVNLLTEGGGKLTLADLNEEGANLLSLQTRQQLGIQALSFAGQNEKAVLSLFR
ncbi:MAG TPA: flagellin [Magnetospirillaceae bacterium]|jgi:flagellin-like hook-associated protein FlgL